MKLVISIAILANTAHLTIQWNGVNPWPGISLARLFVIIVGLPEPRKSSFTVKCMLLSDLRTPLNQNGVQSC